MSEQLGCSVSVAPNAYGSSVVTVIGELDRAATSDLRAAFERAFETGGGRSVEVDMRACSFVDSSGIATLVGAARRLHDDGGLITIRGAQERVRGIVGRAGLADNHWVELKP